MAYTKHEWVTGEIITATNLNHMEDGIASKLDASAVVNSQEADTPGTALDAMQGNPDVPGSLAAQIKEAGESSKAIVLTQAQYDALSDEEKDSDNVYYISDAPFESSNVVPLTRAEYDALSDATKMDGRFYYITDEAEVAKSLVVQNNVNSTETVPSSAVVYGLKSDTDSQISDLNSLWRLESWLHNTDALAYLSSLGRNSIRFIGFGNNCTNIPTGWIYFIVMKVFDRAYAFGNAQSQGIYMSTYVGSESASGWSAWSKLA